MRNRPLAGLEPPFDHELAALRAGYRELVKREFADLEGLAVLGDEGLHVELAAGGYALDRESADIRIGRGDSLTAFIGRTPRPVERALELEHIERHRKGSARDRAVRGLGALLGYPPCCIEAHAASADQSESGSFGRLLAPGPRSGLPRTNNLFVLSHQLISHFPCTLKCPRSAQAGEAALDLLAKEAPERASALVRLLEAPITVWDRFRLLIEHPDAGIVAADALTDQPRLWEHPGFQAFRAALPARPEGGIRLTFDTAGGSLSG